MAYATVAQVRALDGLADTTAYPDATLQDGIDFATELIDDYCGTAFEFKAFDSFVFDVDTGSDLFLDVLFIQTITSVKIDGTLQTGYTFKVRPWGVVKFTNLSFPFDATIEVVGTAGFSATAPKRIAWAARTIARDYALNLHTRTPSRALQITNDLGQIEVRAQAGGPGRPTNMPDVNAVLNRFRHKISP